MFSKNKIETRNKTIPDLVVHLSMLCFVAVKIKVNFVEKESIFLYLKRH